MLLTPDGVRSLLQRLQTEKESLMKDIDQLSVFDAAVTEDVESVRPEFSLLETMGKIAEIDERVLQIRHARNIFNATTMVGNTGLTVDEVLIRMAVLSRMMNTLSFLANRQNKRRKMASGSKEIEYTYANYNIDDAKKIYNNSESELSELREKLDYLNATQTFEIPD